jgi:hypothetical protein
LYNYSVSELLTPFSKFEIEKVVNFWGWLTSPTGTLLISSEEEEEDSVDELA